ncbi:Phosphorylated carbohydrates phosphatase [Corynebacterium atrinae]|uniref:HAD family hydrolase n=1 Tax=Corynebacterium atrinae TaxID=1336740 RepID=UPI0025B40DAE|nr:HAD family phosphatase [Corynebacterium atrinae]WJY63404.1 Phosphorylated carbohydrates phosphatase [Corynebacterium atrinae]
MLKAIFWDMDGTLVDSEPLWEIATYELSERLGRRLTPELRESTVGGSLRHTIDVCASHAGVVLEEADYVTQRRIIYDRMAELMADQLVPNPGVQELLGDFRAAGLPMLVTTNTERELADPSIAAVGASYFSGSVAGDEVIHPKPAPEMYLEAARRVDVAPSDCLVFEDSHAGMTAARAAGCRVIGLADAGPEGVTLLKEIHGDTTFEGVTAEKVRDWFARLSV